MASSIDRVSDKITSWWGPGWTDSDYRVPYYTSLASGASSSLRSGFDVSLRATWKDRTSSPLIRDYIDKWQVGASFSPLTKLASANGRLSKGSTWISSGVAFRTERDHISAPVANIAAGGLIGPNSVLKRPASLRVIVAGYDTADNKSLRAGPAEAHVALDFSHKWLSHSHRLRYGIGSGATALTSSGRSRPSAGIGGPTTSMADVPRNISWINSVVAGYRGLSVGAELETNASLTAIKDINLAAQYSRRDAFTVTVSSERNRETLVLSPLVHLGRDTSIFGMIAAPSADPFGKATAWAAGIRQVLPVKATRTALKLKVEHTGNASLAIDNSDLPFARLAFVITAPVFAGAPVKFGSDSSSSATLPSIGFAATFGDNHNEDDYGDDGMSTGGGGAPALAAPKVPCPHCIA